MLDVLHIENIAVIEQADIRFDSGFNVLTGETGAGKSIVIDAISAILGERAYRDTIRTGADRAFVSAVFSRIPPLPWFEENGITYDEKELLIQREFCADGKNSCRVCGRPVTVSMLRSLGLQLINIHGQHDAQLLFDESTHLGYLDLFAHDEQALSDYRSAYQREQEIDSQIRRLSMDEAEKLRLTQTLEVQIAEIEQAAPVPGEEEELLSRRKILQNSEKLTLCLSGALESLYGGESSDGAAGLLSEAEKALARVSGFSEELEALHETVSDLMYRAQDAADEVRDRIDSLSFSESELERIEQRLDTLHKLKRKYGASVEEVLSFLEKARTKLDEIVFSSERIEKLQKKKEALAQQRQKAGLALREARLHAAEELEKRIMLELSQLDMPRVQFVCQFEPQAPADSGIDSVRFLMSANVGEALRPMAKVASGGELARIMLAMKNVLAELDGIPTLIFDEVDTGVSGRAAQKVAQKLAALSSSRQILCVTHLPQIAAMADTHLLIRKEVRSERTYTSVTPLDRAGRIDELSRLIGGAVITENTKKSAEEMLKR